MILGGINFGFGPTQFPGGASCSMGDPTWIGDMDLLRRMQNAQTPSQMAQAFQRQHFRDQADVIDLVEIDGVWQLPPEKSNAS